MLKQKKYKMLSPSYAYPEGWKIPFEPKMFLIDKKKLFHLSDKSNDYSNQEKPLGLSMIVVKIMDYIKLLVLY